MLAMPCRQLATYKDPNESLHAFLLCISIFSSSFRRKPTIAILAVGRITQWQSAPFAWERSRIRSPLRPSEGGSRKKKKDVMSKLKNLAPPSPNRCPLLGLVFLPKGGKKGNQGGSDSFHSRRGFLFFLQKKERKRAPGSCLPSLFALRGPAKC